MLQSCVHTTRMMNTNRLWTEHLKSFCRQEGMQLSSRGQGLTHHQISLYLCTFPRLFFFFALSAFLSLRAGFSQMVRNVVIKAPVFSLHSSCNHRERLYFFQFQLGQKSKGRVLIGLFCVRCPSLDQSIMMGGGMESCGNMIAT